MHRSIVDDSSPDKGPRLDVREDNQGDLYFSVVGKDGKSSDQIRLCGPGGGSRAEGLADRLKRALFDKEPISMRLPDEAGFWWHRSARRTKWEVISVRVDGTGGLFLCDNRSTSEGACLSDEETKADYDGEWFRAEPPL